jgi:hypothetical protein
MKALLLALEIEPVEAGGIYDSLPLHCTLVHWFWVGGETDLLSRIGEETSQFGGFSSKLKVKKYSPE